MSSVVAGRDIHFVRLFNARDLGGHRTRDGRTVRQGRLIRGAGLHRLAGEDLETLRGLGIRTALDLRTEREIRASGAFPGDEAGVDVRHLPLIPDVWAADHALPDAANAHAFMTQRYVDMLETAGPALARGLETLADADALPAVAFCMAGKDRTGVFVSIVLDVLGVPDEAIAADYARSDEPVKRLHTWLAATERSASGAMDQHPEHLQVAPAEVILAFLTELRRRHGSAAAFVGEHGAGGDVLAAARENLLEGRP